MDSDWHQPAGTVLYLDLAVPIERKEVKRVTYLVDRIHKYNQKYLDINKHFRDGEQTLLKLAEKSGDPSILTLVKSLARVPRDNSSVTND